MAELENKSELIERLTFSQQLEDNTVAASQIDTEYITGYKGLYNRAFKRCVDFILSLLLLIILSPLLLIVALAIKLEDGGPVLYKAERGGYHNKTFKICKFRSMVPNADKIGGGTTALNDNRITKVGSIIRKIKLDEFPNLLNVIKGDMSFIGPRPELLRYTEQYEGAEKYILEVRPGMTDYSSIAFINLDEIVGQGNADEMYEKYVLPEKNKLRVKYAATVSVFTDIKLFIMTVWKVVEKAFGFIFKKEHR